MTEFEAAYEVKVVPILKQHGLAASSERGRATVDSVFSRLFNRYDGKSFISLTTQDGLAHNQVWSILQDREGHLWFGTRGGVSRYDGQRFQTLTYRDGLAGNLVYSILQDREGQFWFGTVGGVTRFQPPAPPPLPAFIDAVVADRRHEKVSELSVPSSVKLTAFEFHAMSFKTRPEQMVYRYRLNGYDKEWKTTHDRRVEYPDLPRGTYTFEVQAVDRDLVYSEKPATVMLRVHLPYERIGLWSALSVAVALVAWQTARVIRRDRRLQEANAALSAANRELFQANVQIQEATKRKSAFLASMSHELRTPMKKFTEKGEVKVSVRRQETGDRRQESVGSMGSMGSMGRENTSHTSHTSHTGGDGLLVVSVSDTGVGIPPEALGLIFEEFRQVEGAHQQQKGTGLGLSITKKLTELLGGTIGVESGVGKGSTFTVRIPLMYKER